MDVISEDVFFWNDVFPEIVENASTRNTDAMLNMLLLYFSQHPITLIIGLNDGFPVVIQHDFGNKLSR